MSIRLRSPNYAAAPSGRSNAANTRAYIRRNGIWKRLSLAIAVDAIAACAMLTLFPSHPMAFISQGWPLDLMKSGADCASRADRAIKGPMFAVKSVAHSFHYNKRLGLCLMTVEDRRPVKGGGETTSKFLLDIKSNRMLAEATWITRPGDPVFCRLPFGQSEADSCTSGEYQGLIANFMETPEAG